MEVSKPDYIPVSLKTRYPAANDAATSPARSDPGAVVVSL